MTAPPVSVECLSVECLSEEGLIEERRPGVQLRRFPGEPLYSGGWAESAILQWAEAWEFATRHEDAHEGLLPTDLAAGVDLDVLGTAVGVPRAGTNTTAALGTVDALIDAASGPFERLRPLANTLVLTPLQWRTLLRVPHRGRRSRQVRGQRARCAVRVERRNALRP